MNEIVELKKVEDYFALYSRRVPKGVYFYRFTSYHPDFIPFFSQMLAEAKTNGLYINTGIPNPDQRQLEYYEEIMGLSFRLAPSFLETSMEAWLPRLSKFQRSALVNGLWEVLDDLRKHGKTENMLRNAYIKFMCWFYYRFEPVLRQTGKDVVPKVLYEGSLGESQLKLLHILARSGCDVLLLIPEGEEDYRKADPALTYTKRFLHTEAKAFPANFSCYSLAAQKTTMPLPAHKQEPSVFFLEPPQTTVSVNTWLSGNLTEDSLKPLSQRGSQAHHVYNMFVRMRGAEDGSTYRNNLIRWKLKLEESGRRFTVLEQSIPMPTVEEIAGVKQQNETEKPNMLQHFVSQIHLPYARELERLLKKAYWELLSEAKDESLQRLKNRAVCVLCWIRRYISALFPDGTLDHLPTFVYYGVCANETEAVWVRLLSRLPVDVWLICPNLDLPDVLSDSLLFDRTYPHSLPLEPFPRQLDGVQFGTVAYHAEQELNTILYQDSGMYRNLQFKKAMPITLQTMYEEIAILWDQEAKYRPNFEVLTEQVMLPVICAKISGVPSPDKYWGSIGKLLGDDVIYSEKVPFVQGHPYNPIAQQATSFLKNRTLQREKIKAHPSYPYAFLREEMQTYMLDKLQDLLDRELIVGTFHNGTEYTILSAALTLDKHILRLIQKFDFTKTNPKLVLVNTAEQMYSLEDSIVTAYLNLLGFDIALFVPTGYQVMERYFARPFFVEQQIGEFVYDLKSPDFSRLSEANQRKSLADIIFKRGK